MAKMTKVAIRKMAVASRALGKAQVALHKTVQKFDDGLLTAGMSVVKNDIAYIVDSKLRIVRKPTKDKPVTMAEVVYLLKGLRVTDEEDALAMVGPNVLRYMFEKEYLVRDARWKSTLWITKKAQVAYGLSVPVICGVPCEFI